MNNQFTTQAGHGKVISFKIVIYSIPCPASSEIYMDRQAAIRLCKIIDRLDPVPLAIQVFYLTYQNGQGEAILDDDAFLSRLSPAIFQRVRAASGRELYRVTIQTLQEYIERTHLEWEVSYLPGEEYDDICRDIQDYIYQCSQSLQQFIDQPVMFSNDNHSFSPTTTMLSRLENNYASEMNPARMDNTFSTKIASNQLANSFVPNLTFPQAETNYSSNIALPTAAATENSFNPALSPQRLDNIDTPNNPLSPRTSISMSPNVAIAKLQNNSNSTVKSPSTFGTPNTETTIQSGFTTPADTPGAFVHALDSIIEEMDTQPCPNTARDLFPVSQFSIAQKQSTEDDQAAIKILSKIRVLAFNPRIESKHRWSLESEKQEIQTMSINTSLNIGKSIRTIPETLEKSFKKYDINDEQGNESFQRALLMIVIRLLRQKFVYESGRTKQPGNFATDFEKLYNFPHRYIKRAGHLCRMVVACGHPCILIFLTRLAIRNRSSVFGLLEDLPINHFCKFISTGKVGDFNQQESIRFTSSNVHKDLLWAHSNLVLPLLQAASRRIPDQLCLVDGTLKCDEETCLRAVVHNAKQKQYSHFLQGTCTNSDWVRGKVLVEYPINPAYSIEKDLRTFYHFKISTFAHIEHFDDPPKFLQSKTLDVTLD